MRKLYFFAYLGFVLTERDFPNLNHKTHEPDPKEFDLDDMDAFLVRASVWREVERSVS